METKKVTTTATVKLKVSDFEYGGLLGEGSFSKVVIGTRKSDKQKFAVKIVSKEHVKRHNKTHTVTNEKNVLNSIDHPNIVKLIHTFQDDFSLYFVLELAPKGEMFDQLQRVGRYELKVAQFYAAELLNVIEYLHTKHILHRDLKPENILLSESFHIKLTDFGEAKMLEAASSPASTTSTTSPSSTSTSPASSSDNNNNNSNSSGGRQASKAPRKSFVGTAEYVSPEILSDQPAAYGADIWSYACVVFQMLTGKPPFRGETEYLTFQKILKREFEFPKDMDEQAKDLINKLLVMDPLKRLGAREDGTYNYATIKAHGFFSGIDFGKIQDGDAPQVDDPETKDSGHDSDEDDDLTAMFVDDRALKEYNEPPSPTSSSSTASASSTTSASAYSASSSSSSTPSSASSSHHDEHSHAHHTKQEHSGGGVDAAKDETKWRRFLEADEEIMYMGLVVKRRGIFAKKRQLILTNLPRFVYVDPHHMVKKGEIKWTEELWPEFKTQQAFWIHTNVRDWHIYGLSSGARAWVENINRVKKAHLEKIKEKEAAAANKGTSSPKLK